MKIPSSGGIWHAQAIVPECVAASPVLTENGAVNEGGKSKAKGTLARCKTKEKSEVFDKNVLISQRGMVLNRFRTKGEIEKHVPGKTGKGGASLQKKGSRNETPRTFCRRRTAQIERRMPEEVPDRHPTGQRSWQNFRMVCWCDVPARMKGQDLPRQNECPDCCSDRHQMGLSNGSCGKLQERASNTTQCC